MTIGVAIAVLGNSHDEQSVCSVASEIMASTPEGRIAAFVWRTPLLLEPSVPTEGILTRCVLGESDERGEDKATDPWLFYANVATRHYEMKGPDLDPAFSSTALLFRRQGPPPYRRLNDGSNPPEMDRLETLHPAFTRDVANNTWILPAESGLLRVAARIALLMSWSDEEISLINLDTPTIPPDLRALGLSRDLLGVPTKVAYNWADHLSGPGQMALQVD